MVNLARREHGVNDLFDLRHSFDQIFNRMLRGSSSTGDREVRTFVAIPPIEVWVDNNEEEISPQYRFTRNGPQRPSDRPSGQ